MSQVRDGSTDKGLRFNAGKTRHDLAPAFAQEQYAKVLTRGANKYGDRNWEKGMQWSKVLESLKRHVLAWELGEDYDQETGEYHMAHVMCNAAFLTEYYKIYPQGDNRFISSIADLRIGLDIDDVLADFVGGYCGEKEKPRFWGFDRNMKERFSNTEDSFWLNLARKENPNTWKFEPIVYISSRDFDVKISEEWLDANGFPVCPVVHVGSKDKVQVCKDYNLDVFVDDNYKTFRQLNKAGITCYLYTALHNERYDVGHKRISNLSELSFVK